MGERERERERRSQERKRKEAEEDRWMKAGVAAYVKKRDQRRAEEAADSRGQSAAAKRAAHRPERAAHQPDVPLGPSNRTNAYGQRKGGRGAIQRRERKQFLQAQAAGFASFADQGAAGGDADAAIPLSLSTVAALKRRSALGLTRFTTRFVQKQILQAGIKPAPPPMGPMCLRPCRVCLRLCRAGPA